VIPIMLILVGIFVVWLEADELSAEKEMKADEKSTEAEEVKEVKAAVAPLKKKATKARKKK